MWNPKLAEMLLPYKLVHSIPFEALFPAEPVASKSVIEQKLKL